MNTPLPDASWAELTAELDTWRAAGRTATLWWRDDDAIAPTPALERLVAAAGRVPLTLAVIPAAAAPELAAWHRLALRRGHAVGIVQHGWRHRDHSVGGRKSEFPGARPAAAIATDLAAGRARLRQLFGAAALPVLAPPWNRFDESFLPLLGAAGIAGLSRLGPRGPAAASLAQGNVAQGNVAQGNVAQNNVHVDLVAWKAGRGFIGAGAALSGLLAHLRARRLGAVDAAEPTGILTHHLVQDDAAGAFLVRLAALILGHPAARWLDAEGVFADEGARQAA
jgi:hypothetical protein